MSNSIFIPGNVPSSKNSKVWTGRFLVHSKQTTRYVKDTKKLWDECREQWLDMLDGAQLPYTIGLCFVRADRRKFDQINMAQIVFDLMVKHGWIEDDNAKVVLPVFLPHVVDKTKPGVFIFAPKLMKEVYHVGSAETIVDDCFPWDSLGSNGTGKEGSCTNNCDINRGVVSRGVGGCKVSGKRCCRGKDKPPKP